MSNSAPFLDNDQLIAVFNLTKTATAIHVGENAVIQSANDAMLQIWGKDRSVLGKSLEEALPELKSQPFIGMFAKVWNEGITISGKEAAANLEIEGIIETFYFDFEYQAIKDDTNKVICILHTAIDVTERVLNKEALEKAFEKEEALAREQALNEELASSNEELSAINEELQQAQESLNELNIALEQRVESRVKDLKESEARFRTMAEGTDILIAVGDETSNAVYFNKAWTDLTGRSMEDLLAFGWADLIHPEDSVNWVNNYLNAFKAQISFAGEFRVLGKNGDYRWLLAKGPPRFKSDGSFAGYISSCIDITDRKLDELEKEILTDELATINEEMVASNEELQSANEELISAQDLLGSALEQLTKSDTRLKFLLADAPIPIAVLSGRGMIVESANKKILELWGKSTQIVGKPLIEGLPELMGQPFLQWLDDVYISGKPYFGNEARAFLAEKETYLNFVYKPILDEHDNTDGILITASDVTEQVLSRRKVEHAEAMLRLAIDAANFGTWHINAETRTLIANNRFKELFGFYHNDEITINDAIAQITDEYRDDVARKIEIAITQGGNYDLSYSIKGFRDQKIRWVRAIGNLSTDYTGEFSAFTGVIMDITDQITANKAIKDSEEKLRQAIETGKMGTWSINPETQKVTMSDFVKDLLGLPLNEQPEMEAIMQAIHPDYHEMLFEALNNALQNHQPSDTEYPITNLITQEEKWVRATGRVFVSESGIASEYSGIFMDITERKLDELRKNDFIGMVSHELKTPLTSLNGYIQMLQRKLNKTDDKFTIDALEVAYKQVKKMTSMINGFLNISRLESGKILLNKSKFDLNELIKLAVEEATLMDTSHQIHYQNEKSVDVFADYDKINNVISNLLSNAVKYAPNHKDITVKCKIVNEHVQVSIKDEGMGIAEKDIKRLFERYYRVESDSTISGFGIGLYLSAEIIERHNGKITVESKLGAGSTFYFSLPLNS